MLLICGWNLKNEFYWDYIPVQEYLLSYQLHGEKMKVQDKKRKIKRIVYITKCPDCNKENCKLRQLCGSIPDECPLDTI